ncbi:hypothetical protein NW752_002284 [Fusarium irregulare]|uniref:Uncharacterized protein n=1 Tax=Fusarium irregulare TaxID=2494466 RepID=A0A9W8PG01_9HYPO|nr:hypothetical protein NW766_010999 [Fusarium irregulare]KAJ4024832.1 hypothetical protein NW752_002284 [Fusarium irregulare]
MVLQQLDPSKPSGPQELVRLTWNFSDSRLKLYNGDSVGELCHSAYFEYYQHQWGLTVAHYDGKFVALKTPEAMNQLVQQLQRNRSRAELLEFIKSRSDEGVLEEACESSLNLAVRLLLMVKIGAIKYQFHARRCLGWSGGSPRDFINTQLGKEPVLEFKDIKVPKAFNGWSLEKVGGIKICFDNNLADHLLLVEDDSKVLVFPYVSFLESQRLKGDESLFPTGFAEETLRTLALLFPQSLVMGSGTTKGSRKAWFSDLCSKRSTFEIDTRLGSCGTLQAEDRQIKDFKFWRDRLVILKQAYDEATPSSLTQIWHDNRNGVQWYTFWLVILIFIIGTIFSVLHSVQGGFQAWGKGH